MKTCSSCKKEKTLEDFSKRSLSKDGYSASCKVCVSTRKSQYLSTKNYNKKKYWADPESNKERKKQWAKDNPEKVNSYKRDYRKKEPLKHLYWDTLKWVSRKQRVPVWLSEEQKKEIEYFYWLAKDLQRVSGEKYQVDHIVPLKGKTVCGLHVPWNLQVLPSDINNKKSNNFLEQGFSANTGGATQ